MWRLLLLIFIGLSCRLEKKAGERTDSQPDFFVVVLGTVQDAGSPQAGCHRACCSELYERPDPTRMVVSLGIVDKSSGKSFIIEATPDFPQQLNKLREVSGIEMPSALFLTHARVGHYTGLMYLGKESMATDQLPVYAMPRMHAFLSANGPWDQLVSIGNIDLRRVTADSAILVTPNVQVIPFLVPHRDEYSETVGYRIKGPDRTLIFIPDIDKWEHWDRAVVQEVRQVDYALLDATFYSGEEIGTRDLSTIPHPFVTESMEAFEELSPQERGRIRFIHLNHTNPLLSGESEETRAVRSRGFWVAVFGEVLPI